MRKVLAGSMIGLAMLGMVACGSPTYSDGYVDTVEYGYYDTAHVYHVYSTPHHVHVRRSYITSHGDLFSSTYARTHTHVTTTKTTKVHTNPVTGRKTVKTTTLTRITKHH